MKGNVGAILVGALVALVIGALSLFVVDQRQNAIVFRLGEVIDVKREPGLYFKVPLLENVRNFDVRILTIESAEPERFLTSEKKNVLVDLFVKWRITDVRQYYVSVGGNEGLAQTRLLQTINDGLRAEFGNRTVHDVVSGERDKIMDLMRDKANEDAKTIGVEVLDVRIKRVDLPQEVSVDVYRRMEAERKRVANELRSTGFAESERIRAEADKQREVIVAQAYREAQRIKGEGDAKATAIYARAYEQNAEFYAFYRSLEAYKASFRGRNDVLVLEPSSEFFKYLRSSGRQGKYGTGAPHPFPLHPPHSFPLSQAVRGRVEPPFSTREKGGDEGSSGEGKSMVRKKPAGYSRNKTIHGNNPAYGARAHVDHRGRAAVPAAGAVARHLPAPDRDERRADPLHRPHLDARRPAAALSRTPVTSRFEDRGSREPRPDVHYNPPRS